MKYILILTLAILLTSCTAKQENVAVENDIGIANEITTQPELYSIVTEVTFHDPKDIENFNTELKELDKEIASNTGSITYDQIVAKARLLDYLGQTGEALELYETNFSLNKNDRSLAYNHNLARLYERVGSYNDALKRYEFLITYFNRGDYLKDVANIWKIRGDDAKYKKAMTAYNKVMNKTPTNEVKIQEVTVGADGVLELK